MKKITSLLIVLLVSVFSIFAKSVSIQVIQNCIENDEVFDSSYLIEQSIIDFLFDSGHVVSNSPIFIKSTDSKVNSIELNKVLTETQDGSMDYLIRIEVEYDLENSKNPKAFLLSNIKELSWINYSAKTGKQISAGKLPVKTVNPSNNNEQGITSFASVVASKITTGLR